MANVLEGLTETVKWHLMVEAAKRGLEANGYKFDREPGRGLSNVWTITKDGKSQKASVRTTRDRWIAFPPLDGGKKWKTLDEVDAVIVATVDDRDDPKRVEVYLFPATDVRGRFDAAFAARTGAGQTVRNNFGMWVRLDHDSRKIPRSVGSGIVDHYKPIATFPIVDLLAEGSAIDPAALEGFDEDAADDEPQVLDNDPPLTIAEAKRRLALTFGVKPDNIKITVEA
ncbi:hypothetical protein [Bradyrhizobium elkanii]|jgi:hypothetical protein|uniref:Restriction endonuclease n=1 Tax=Bradyrhizobium elkanii TaxID=29448 RepID=A0ABV4F047_BRAEL|nr:hypothetical protein [Bradyrhizobium elkanii]MCP1757811.1 hypothetical protein [Bradyrhizobium elkanii]MCS3881892.1 hypothetical protein [Bradyrhizobium elkanii]MCS4218652.1 hypothetical protein [Bradyrhizobium elkanii]MCW2110049.1 hypothetical protein [Bradyrhizobium elkanii]MCW2201579.1 hypothetical protein [Bradyrhizobium elkanii]